MAFLDYKKLVEKLRKLKEIDFRKVVRVFFSNKLSDGNVQPFHGVGEHGKDTLATISQNNDPLRKGQIVILQAKIGDISYHNWEKEIAPQFDAALRSTNYPFGMSRDNSRRLILTTNGKIKPEAYKGIEEWNKSRPIPVECFDIDGFYDLFSRYNLTDTDIDDLLESADKFNF